MANQVKARINSVVEVKHKDFEIVIRNDGQKLGTLLISKGNMEWLPKGNSINKRRLRWTDFAKIMEGYGRKVKVRKP